MRKYFLIAVILYSAQLFAQNKSTDSLKEELLHVRDDNKRFLILNHLFDSYIWIHPDSAAPYSREELTVAKQTKQNNTLKTAYLHNVWLNMQMGNYPDALSAGLNFLKEAKRTPNNGGIAIAYMMIASIYSDISNYEQAIKYVNLTTPYLDSYELHPGNIVYMGIAQVYEKFNHLDSALKYAKLLGDAYIKFNGKITWAPVLYTFGNIYSKMGRYAEAVKYYRSGADLSKEDNNSKDLMDNYMGLANIFRKNNQNDSSLIYANDVLELSKSAFYMIKKIEALNLLKSIYTTKQNPDSVSKYLELSIATRDSVFSLKNMMQMQDVIFKEKVSQLELDEEAKQLRNRIILYATITALLVFLVIAYLLYRNNLQKQKAFALLQKQKQETDIQKNKAEQTLEELKTTQSQLIQSEKMASLGELTAGVAHEIQNPLNFVNNFSEVNKEMLIELNQELEKGNLKEAESIAKNVIDNEEKIHYHGRRADAIVKSMLQHSRSSTGSKEPTDINILADEYLKLAYHGFRAKDQFFVSSITTNFDSSTGKISIVPQDLARVLLNIYNNAFYAVAEKKRKNSQKTDYEPTVSVSTKKSGNHLIIEVKDNGCGIPDKVFKKIFQPFFTTKPSGQGTGLGLSLSYDIIKAHGGEILVNTKEGEFTEFVIRLPTLA